MHDLLHRGRSPPRKTRMGCVAVFCIGGGHRPLPDAPHGWDPRPWYGADDAHAYELIRCVRLFPGDAQGEDVLAADYRRSGLTKKNADLKVALDGCLETLHPRFLLEPERLVPVPQSRKLREDLREALLWQGYEENYESAIRSVFVGGVGWISPQDVKKQRQLPLVLSYRVDGMSKDGAYLSLELEPWEYDLLLEQTKNHYKNKEKRNTK